MTNLIKQLNRTSDVKVMTTFGVGKEDFYGKNKNQSFTPNQVKRIMIRSGEYRFITPSRELARKKSFEKSGLEKIKLNTLKKSSSFAGKTLFTNKLN